MGTGVGQLCCGCVGVVAILLVAAGLLRLAIFTANRNLGHAKPTAEPRSGGIAEWDWDDWDDEQDAEPTRPWERRAIPEAGTFKCMTIMLMTALVFGFGFVVMGFAAQDVGFRMHRDETQLAVAILNLPVAGLALTVLLALFLPTNFWRAGMVAFLFGVFVFAFLLFVGVPVLLITAVGR
jgi:hypothetical protein